MNMLKRIDNFVINMSNLKQVTLVYLIAIILQLFCSQSMILSSMMYAFIILIVIYLSYRQGLLKELGFKKLSKNKTYELIAFLVLSIIYIVYNFYSGYKSHRILELFYQVCLVGFGTEILFRGFIAKKLPIKNRAIRYIVVGIMYVCLFLPDYYFIMEDKNLIMFQSIYLRYIIRSIQYQVLYDYFQTFIPGAIVSSIYYWI